MPNLVEHMNCYTLCGFNGTVSARDLPEFDWRVAGFIPLHGKKVLDMKTGDVLEGHVVYGPGTGYAGRVSPGVYTLVCDYKGEQHVPMVTTPD